MCGIFGVTVSANSGLNRWTLERLIERLFKLSESRGRESAGIQVYLPVSRKSWIIKSDQTATKFMQSLTYRKNLNEALNLLFESSDRRPNQPAVFMGHSRLVTNGSAQRSENNQPVTWGDTTVIHNGIVVNVEEIWFNSSNLQRHAEVDTEVIAALLDFSLQSEWNPIAAIRDTFTKLDGSASIAWTHLRGMFVGAGTNTGDLFLARLSKLGAYVFSSERFILESALAKVDRSALVSHVQASRGFVVTLHDNALHLFNLSPLAENGQENWLPKLPETCLSNASNDLSSRCKYPRHIGRTEDESLLRYNEESLLQLRRCSRCVLPDTFPFINFDSEGVCNYCHCYLTKYKGVNQEAAKRKFLSKIERYRRSDGRAEVIVPLSGGRDSCFGLHLLKEEFGLNPITFTYDWGMVTDLARRNIARICGELGVQNILVSADINLKRRNIQRNVAAWLNKPELSMVPLFMAGDKHFIKEMVRLKHQLGVDLNIWSGNFLENTDFKTGLAGLRPNFKRKAIDHLNYREQGQLVYNYMGEMLSNPKYINFSIWDTATAFFSYYVTSRRDRFDLFYEIPWAEADANSTVVEKYGFERSTDSQSLWRVGDGTAAFYNYIYVTALGFSEFDTFRSNQVREGFISREHAIQTVLIENRPRASGLKWYLDAISLEFKTVIQRINTMDVYGLHS